MEIDKSLALSKIALDKSYFIQDPNCISKSYNLIAINFGEFGNVEKQIYYYNKAIEYAQKAKNDTLNIVANFNLANVYFRNLKNYPKAIEYFSKHLSLGEKIKSKKEIADAKINLCEVYFEKKEFEKGFSLINQSDLEIDRFFHF